MRPADRPEKASAEDIRRFQANLDDEIDGIAVYRMLAAVEKDPARKEIFEELLSVELKHADVWRAKLLEAGIEPRERGPSLKIRLMGLLARWFGVRSVLPIVRSMEAGAYAAYMGQGETGRALAPDEARHNRILSRLEYDGRVGLGGGLEGIAKRETWHRSGGGGMLRASVFGLSDGILSNTSLIMSFAGAQVDGKFLILAGVGGLLAGSFSMGAGEYVSMRAQRELFERQIQLEREELEVSPDEETAELALIYRAKGLAHDQADAIAAQLMDNPEAALDTLVREELGLDPSALGSPWGAAIGSFFSFAAGAIVPVVPFFFSSNVSILQIAISAGASGVVLFGIGAALSLFTGRSPMVSGIRQLSIGTAAATITFGVGRLIGVSTGI